MILLDETICRNYSDSSRREWLEANGLGSFASGTVSSANTRRYHGLLTASLHPPGERFVLLSKLEETILIGNQRYELSSNQYRFVKGTISSSNFGLTLFRAGLLKWIGSPWRSPSLWCMEKTPPSFAMKY